VLNLKTNATVSVFRFRANMQHLERFSGLWLSHLRDIRSTTDLSQTEEVAWLAEKVPALSGGIRSHRSELNA